MKEKPSDNRIFTGNDKPLTTEQAGNLLKSPEFSLHQKDTIKDILKNAQDPRSEAMERRRQMHKAIDLIADTPDGKFLGTILKCRFEGYSYKKIAKTLMKSERNLPYFSSLTKATDYVKEREKTAFYRVRVALSKQSRMISNSGIIIP